MTSDRRLIRSIAALIVVGGLLATWSCGPAAPTAKAPNVSHAAATLPSPATGPGPAGCKGSSVAYDPARGSLIVVGGACLAGSHDIAQTWAFTNAAWTHVAGTLNPSWRYDASIAYDPRSKSVILFGGTSADSSLLSDTWRLDSSGWTQLHVPGPSAREGAAFGLDGLSGSLMLFGGVQRNGRADMALADQWFWNGSGWTAGQPKSGPPGRFGASLAFDPDTNTTMLYGGNSARSAIYHEHHRARSSGSRFARSDCISLSSQPGRTPAPTSRACGTRLAWLSVGRIIWPHGLSNRDDGRPWRRPRSRRSNSAGPYGVCRHD
jgi:hypothetical protein